MSSPLGNLTSVSPDPVLLLHGFATSSARTWGDNGWIDLLGDVGRTVIAPDLLGHGTAAKPHDPAAYADFEYRVIDHLDETVLHGPVDGVGFSLGARTLLVLAAAQPERFGRLVVAGVGANLFTRSTDPEMLAGMIEQPQPPDDPALAYFHRLAHADGNDPLALAASLRRPPGGALSDEALARITGPVLVVLGDRDFTGPADPLIERLVNAEVTSVTLRDTDHFATPKSFAFLDATLDFLAEGA